MTRKTVELIIIVVGICFGNTEVIKDKFNGRKKDDDKGAAKKE